MTENDTRDTGSSTGSRGGFMAVEKTGRGGFGLGFYARYLKAMHGVAFVGPFLAFLLILETFSASGFRWLVAIWVEGCQNQLCADKSALEKSFRQAFDDVSGSQVLLWFASYVLACVVVRTVSWTSITGFLANGGRHLHNAMVESFGRVRVTFFDENPTGRLVRRFSGDYDHLKREIPNYINDVFGSLAELIWILILVFIQAPLACLACVPCAVLYFRVQKLYRPASREIQRLTKVLETPIWSLFTETVVGTQSIRAYGRSQEFAGRLSLLYERFAYGALAQSRLTRWLNMRLKFISELFAVCLTLYIAYSCSNGRMGVGTAGFLMSLTIGLDVTMQWLTRTLSLIESTMVSLERILEYRDLPAEDATRVGAGLVVPEGAWPPRGEISFSHFSASYREDLSQILCDLSVVFPAGKRTGIIGRTGAGKSSLFQALFGMLCVHAGSLKIDGIDVAQVDLARVRAMFGIIPQEPHLFSGTLRYNLDRTGRYLDSAMWQALEQVNLAGFVRSLPGGLGFSLVERGANFSLGQRQLLCMARTILTDARVILMDEATASVDLDTDKLIHAATAKVFAGRTVLIIAHRLETVRDCDHLVVMGQGRLLDFGTPEVILSNINRQSAADLDLYLA